MTDKISSEDFIKAFGGGVKHKQVLTEQYLKRPQGDLISREALKKYARTRISEEIVTNQVILKLFDELIDDAPAVEPDLSNDLISRTELKKCAIPCEIHNGALTELCVPLYQIDNAPTVKAFTLVDIEEQYKKGLEKGLSEWETERPQGKWIKITREGTVPAEYVCSCCGRKIYDNYELSIPMSEFYPYCHCGADMRGDK